MTEAIPSRCLLALRLRGWLPLNVTVLKQPKPIFFFIWKISLNTCTEGKSQTLNGKNSSSPFYCIYVNHWYRHQKRYIKKIEVLSPKLHVFFLQSNWCPDDKLLFTVNCVEEIYIATVRMFIVEGELLPSEVTSYDSPVDFWYSITGNSWWPTKAVPWVQLLTRKVLLWNPYYGDSMFTVEESTCVLQNPKGIFSQTMLKWTIEGTKVKCVFIVLSFVGKKRKKRNVLEDVLCLLQGTLGLYLGFMSLKNLVTRPYNHCSWC